MVIEAVLPLPQLIVTLDRLQILHILFNSLVQVFKRQSNLPYALVFELLLCGLLLAGLVNF